MKINQAFQLSLSIVFMTMSLKAAEPSMTNWFYNPFNARSAHHRPIGTGAIYAGKDHPATKNWLSGQGSININAGAPFGCTIVSVDETDPLMIVDAGSKQCDAIKGLPVRIRIPKEGLRTTIKRNVSGCPDGNIAIYDYVTGKCNHIRQYDWNDGHPKGGQYEDEDIHGIGHGEKLGDRKGTSAAGVVSMFGILRGWEVKKTGQKIGHAIQMSLPRLPRNKTMMINREVWWPAVSMDRGAFISADNNMGHIPYGSLWAIPTVEKGGPDLASLGLSEKGLRFAECLRDYGMYVVDGGDGPNIRGDQEVKDFAKELKEASKKVYPYIRMVLNSVPDEGKVTYKFSDKPNHPSGSVKQIIRGTFPAGGGKPLAPNTAIDAGSR